MTNIYLYIICIVISILDVVFFIIYLTKKKHYDYLSCFNTVFTLAAFFNMLPRLIPLSRADDRNSNDISVFCKIQAFFLSFFDKLIIALITSFSIFSYVIKFKKGIKEKQKKNCLIISMNISLLLSLILSVIFLTQGISDKSEFCYVDTQSSVKVWIDSIFTGILYIINLFITFKMVFCGKNIGKDEGKKSYKCDLILFYLRLIINLTTLTYVFFLILRKLPFKGYVKDLIYIILCLIVNIFFLDNNELNGYNFEKYPYDKNDIYSISNILENDNDNDNDNNNNNNNDNNNNINSELHLHSHN